MVVDADHRQVLGHPEPLAASRPQHAEGHLVGGAEDRRGPGREGQQPVSGARPALEREAALELEVGVRLDPGVAQRVAVAARPGARRGQAQARVVEHADVGDAAVAQLEQVLHRGACHQLVVDADAGPLRDPRSHRHHRHPLVAEPVHLLGRGAQPDDEHRVDALGQQVGAQHPAPRLLVVVEVVEQHVVPALAQHLLGTGDDGGEEPAGHEEHHDRHGAGLAAAGQADGVRGRHVAQPHGGLHHATTGVLGDPGQPAQGAGDGRRGHPGLPGQVVDAGHRASSLYRSTTWLTVGA